MRAEVPGARIAVTLLGGFACIVEDTPADLSLPAQRMLAAVALEPSGLHRAQLAQSLWPDRSPPRAAANLRSALWQVGRSAAAPALSFPGPRLRLSDEVTVDVRATTRQLRALLSSPDTDARLPDQVDNLVSHLRLDLLPGWDDAWLRRERERWSAGRLRALEQLARHLLDERCFALAHRAAEEAVVLDPVRETTHRLVVELDLAEDDPASALNHYRRYRDLLFAEHGIEPSALMEDLVRSVRDKGATGVPAHEHAPVPATIEPPERAALERAETVFRLLDTDADGRISAEDFRRMSAGVVEVARGSSAASTAAMRAAFERYWRTVAAGKRDITLYEFTSCILSPARFGATIDEFADALARLGDPNGDGHVAQPRLADLLSAIGFRADNIDALFDALAFSAGGVVSVRAWADAVRDYCGPNRAGIPADHLVPQASAAL